MAIPFFVMLLEILLAPVVVYLEVLLIILCQGDIM